MALTQNIPVQLHHCQVTLWHSIDANNYSYSFIHLYICFQDNSKSCGRIL